MHAIERRTVDGGFGFAEPLEKMPRPRLAAGAQCRLIDQLVDFIERPVALSRGVSVGDNRWALVSGWRILPSAVMVRPRLSREDTLARLLVIVRVHLLAAHAEFRGADA